MPLFAEFIANDKPFLIRYDGRFYFPAVVTYAETTFGGEFETAADYRDPYLQEEDRREGRLHAVAADPLFLFAPTISICRRRRPRRRHGC